MHHFRLPCQQHCQVPARLHQQGLGGLHCGVSGCFFSVPSGKETHSSVPAASWDLWPLISVLFGSFQDFQFYIQNFTALQLGTVVPPARQATFEYSFIPAEPMGGRPFGLVINLNYKDNSVSSYVSGNASKSKKKFRLFKTSNKDLCLISTFGLVFLLWA